jgi:hypothetical protein
LTLVLHSWKSNGQKSDHSFSRLFRVSLRSFSCRAMIACSVQIGQRLVWNSPTWMPSKTVPHWQVSFRIIGSHDFMIYDLLNSQTAAPIRPDHQLLLWCHQSQGRNPAGALDSQLLRFFLAVRIKQMLQPFHLVFDQEILGVV